MKEKPYCEESKGQSQDALRARKLKAARETIGDYIDASAEKHGLEITPKLKEKLLDEVTLYTHEAKRGVAIVEHLFEAQVRLPSLGNDELRKERIAHAEERTRAEEPSFSRKADKYVSEKLAGRSGGGGFDRF